LACAIVIHFIYAEFERKFAELGIAPLLKVGWEGSLPLLLLLAMPVCEKVLLQTVADLLLQFARLSFYAFLPSHFE